MPGSTPAFRAQAAIARPTWSRPIYASTAWSPNRRLAPRPELPYSFHTYTYNSAGPRDQRMPRVPTRDGIQLYCEEAGAGLPVVFIHEYAADYRTWEPQMRHFSRSHRCVTYSQRGYPPSDVPKEPDQYLQDAFRDDVIAVMDALN